VQLGETLTLMTNRVISWLSPSVDLHPPSPFFLCSASNYLPVRFFKLLGVLRLPGHRSPGPSAFQNAGIKYLQMLVFIAKLDLNDFSHLPICEDGMECAFCYPQSMPII
jgi:hypothetical protein